MSGVDTFGYIIQKRQARRADFPEAVRELAQLVLFIVDHDISRTGEHGSALSLKGHCNDGSIELFRDVEIIDGREHKLAVIQVHCQVGVI